MRRNNLRFGLLLGTLIPVIGCFLYYIIQFSHFATIGEFFRFLMLEKRLLTAMVCILLVANIATFTYYINTRKDRTAKGIFIVTVILGLASVLWKFLG